MRSDITHWSKSCLTYATYGRGQLERLVEDNQYIHP